MSLSQNAKLGIIAVAIVGGGTLLLALVVGVVLLVGGNKTAPTGGAAKTGEVQKATGKPWAREEFKKMVLGKSQKQIIDMLGKPDKTSEIGGERQFDYEKITSDPLSGKIDYATTIWFDGDVAYKLTF